MSELTNFPQQTLSYKRKGKKWRKQCMDWADKKTFFNYNLVRKSVMHKRINYDLVNGILHPSDMKLILNPDDTEASYIPDNVQHYPTFNSKLNVLRGEEAKRANDFKAIITNPTGISLKEESKKEELFEKLKGIIEDTSQSEEEFNQKIEKLTDYYNYEWQDFREMNANALVKHYSKELNIDLIFNNGFMDALTVAEEMYQIDIIGGEPSIEKLNPLKTRIFKSGFSNKIEDADMIIIEDYWSPGRIIDTFYDVLTQKDIDYIESLPHNLDSGNVDKLGNIDQRATMVNANMIDDSITRGAGGFLFDPNSIFSGGLSNSLLPQDLAGNIRVVKLYWKSKRKVKKVKSFDLTTGEEIIEFYPEDYEINKDMGEEETILYVNEAWEGTKIGTDIYVNVRPRPIQYNRLSNPSRCHFGIIGSVYNLNDSRPFSLVDMLKPYAYLYDAIHDKLNKAIASNWGNMLDLDLSKVPDGWEVDKWLYFAKVNHVRVTDSFKEGNIGSASGILAGSLNNASSGGISLDQGNFIQQLVNLLEFIKSEMSEVVGISKQREGQISNRETVGGVERATLQSSHITEWLFTIHEDIKKRVLECLLETAKIATRGKSLKFQNILGDLSTQVIDIDGDLFADCDYGIVMDNSNESQDLKQNLNQLAQAALQNQLLSFSTITKLYSSASLAEKQRMIEADEKKTKESQAQSAQQESEQIMQIEQSKIELEQQKLALEEQKNIRDNETKIMIANLSSLKDIEDGISVNNYTEKEKAELLEKMRQFDAQIKLDREKLSLEKKKVSDDKEVKLKQIQVQRNNKKVNSK